jgi:iron complex outermembrane receptor protein
MRLTSRDICAWRAAACVFAAAPGAAMAAAAPAGGDPAPAVDEVVVTGTKQVGPVRVHDAPLAVTAFGKSALEAAHVDQLSDLTNLVPNVFLNSSETVQGVNNFSIRGMAVYDTIPSNTPTVGIFVDGVYIGASAGSALNTFDNASVEVLRGPQGLLFGRNVTAGALLVNTTDPSGQLHFSGQATVESGPDFTESAVLTGPLTANGMVDGKLGVYRNDDRGYFKNQFDGRQFGASDTTILRGALLINPDGALRTVLRYEHGAENGQGPASQNHGVFSANGFGFSINQPGFSRDRWDQVVADTRQKVSFGSGEIVNVLGWRKVSEAGLFDADSTPQTFFHFATDIDQHQISDELRYSGTLGRVTPTVGLYFYTDHLGYIENRQLAVANITGGGLQDSTTYAAFSNFDIALRPGLTLTLGARYSGEKKSAQVQGLVASATSPCSISAASCSAFDFRGSHSWFAFTPKVGLAWAPDSATNVYAYWTKGFRSGGYNLRQTNLLAPPGPYGQEVENTFEIGAKRDFLDNRLRINAAIFDNEFKNLQRAILQSSPTLGIVQTTANSADTQVTGFEGEVTAQVTDRLRLGGHVGYLHNHWTRIYIHLLGAGPVTPADYALQLPFLSPWSFGANAEYVRPSPFGDLAAQATYDHRDATPSNDANTGWLKAVNRIDVNLTLRAANGLSYSLYGKNLTNQVTTGLNNPLTFTPGETIAPLNKGRIVGLEVRYRY